MTTKTEAQHERLELAEARILANDLWAAEHRSKLPKRVRRLWRQSIQRHLDRASGREPVGSREHTTLPGKGS